LSFGDDVPKIVGSLHHLGSTRACVPLLTLVVVGHCLVIYDMKVTLMLDFGNDLLSG
jgi:hypothetical protein